MKSSTTDRPWGSFTQFTHNEVSTVKTIFIKSGEQLSLQYHNKREEFWKVISGNPTLTIGDKLIEAKPGDEFTIPTGAQHRIAAPHENAMILEISLGDFDENDIIRLEDKYGRS